MLSQEIKHLQKQLHWFQMKLRYKRIQNIELEKQIKNIILECPQIQQYKAFKYNIIQAINEQFKLEDKQRARHEAKQVPFESENYKQIEQLSIFKN